MALHLSATTGEAVTAAQLLGEEGTDAAARLEEAEKSAADPEKLIPAGGIAVAADPAGGTL